MTAEEQNSEEINTVEEYSIYSLSRSVEGLKYIQEDAISCCTEIEQNNLNEAYTQLIGLTSQLHSFDTFEHEMSSLLQLEASVISDTHGNLEQTENAFRSSLTTLGNLIAGHDFKSIPAVIKNSMIPSIERFISLMPVLSNYITTEFVNA